MKSLLLWLTLILPVFAKRSFMATSLVTCMENSQISPSYFNVTFNPDDLSLRYNLDMTTEISANVTAHVQIYAYGFLLLNKKIDMCDLGWKQFCPIYPGTLQIESIQYIDKSFRSLIPGIAFTVPDIDAIVKVNVYDRSTGERLSCLQSSFSNGRTVSQTSIKWATACIAGMGLLIAAVMSTFGNSNAASHIATNAASLFLYFQSVVIVCMQSVVLVPPIASAWSENLAWSMGLIRVEFMQKIFRWYVQSTGGSPTVYFLGTTKQILVQRALKILDDAHQYVKNDFSIAPGHKRSLEYSLDSNSNLRVLRGIKRIGYNSHIEPTSIVVTGFTFFVIMGFLLAAVIVFVRSLAVLLIRTKRMNPNRLSHFRQSFPTILKGALLRYVYIGFPQLVILSLWEFTVHDSPAVIVLACLFLILAVGIIAYAFWNTYVYGRSSERNFNNPAAILYGDTQVLHKFGFCYTMFHAEKYWFGMVVIGYIFFKAIFIGLCQGSGKVSSVVLFVADLAYMIYLFIQKPFMNKSTNILNYCMAVVMTINSFLFVFFSDIFGQPAQVSSIMGWVFFILNAAFSLVLLIMIIVLILLAVLSKNPDARFAPAKDDRTSFQRKSSVKQKFAEKKNKGRTHNELFALGAAAQEHHTNWESEMYRLHDISQQSNSSASSKRREGDDEKTDSSVHEYPSPALEQDAEHSPSLGERMKSSIGRAISTKSLSPVKLGRSKSKGGSADKTSSADVPIRHSRHESMMSESAFSDYSDAAPTNRKGLV